MKRPAQALSITEFIALAALMTSIIAMATDVMLPALSVIGEDLHVADPNSAQLVISTLFIGFAVGQLLAGPLSDRFGRKPVIYLGYIIFAGGCLLSMFATSFTMMLVGRVLQGLGAAGPRIITVSLVRDGYAGASMARIMSIVMAVFIFVPIAAPAIGQVIIALSGWRATFTTLLVLAAAGFAWLALRQPETLPVDRRRPLSFASVGAGLREAVRMRTVTGYVLMTGFVFGPFLGYLSSAQQIFETTYRVGDLFPILFGAAAIAIGAASIANSMLVVRLGMRLLVRFAFMGIILFAVLFLIPTLVMDGVPPLWLFMAWLAVTFFCMGLLFGNLNALAMEPLGHMAGLGAALVGSVSTFIAAPVGWFVGKSFDGTVQPLVIGFVVFSITALLIMHWVERYPPFSRRRR